MALVVLVAGFFAVALALPVVRHRLRTGESGVVVQRAADPFQRFVGLAFAGTLAQVGGVVVARAVFGPAALGEVPVPAAVPALGWALAAVGLGLVVLAQATMGRSWRIGIDDRPTDLVAHGVYRWIRHPIYTGLGLLAVALVAIAPSPWTVLTVPLVAWQLGLQSRLEDLHLARLHGPAFDRWAARTGRFFPQLQTEAP
jgi:protein-S-isoprenylcysteine O-methyltransferase Ste14